MESGGSSSWFTTRSRLFHGGDEQWDEIAAYAAPIRAFLATRFPRLPESEREDLVQDLLVEMRQRLVRSYDGARGRFRQLLKAAIRSRAIDRLRRLGGRRTTSPDEVPAPPIEDEDVEAIDLETSILEALSAARDDLTQGPGADLDVLYALGDRIVHGKTEAAIAAESGVSRDVVARRLRKGRERVLAHLLAREVDLTPEEPRLPVAVEVVRAALQRPAERAALLDRLSDRRLREETDDFLTRFLAARARFPSLESPSGAEFRRGLEVILSC